MTRNDAIRLAKSEMVKRVMLAIDGVSSIEGGVWYSELQKVAHAAIEAMREPTEDMISAANRNNHPRDAETWKTMIDAALK